jgi:hypothetical protein
LTEKTGHNGRAWAMMVGGGARFPRQTPVIPGSGGALVDECKWLRPLGALIGEGEVQTREAGRPRAGRALPRPVPARPFRQAIEYMASLSLVIFKC